MTESSYLVAVGLLLSYHPSMTNLTSLRMVNMTEIEGSLTTVGTPGHSGGLCPLAAPGGPHLNRLVRKPPHCVQTPEGNKAGASGSKSLCPP